MTQWYWMNKSGEQEPSDQQDLLDLLANGTIDEKTLVWKEGFNDWIEIKNAPEFSESTTIPPPPPDAQEGIGKKVLQDLTELDFKEEVLPLNAENVKQMSKDFIFWSVSLLAVLPLFIVTLKNTNYQLVGFALFFAFLWGVVFRQFVVKSSPPWRYLILSLFATGLLGLPLLLQLYKVLPDFYNELPADDHLMVRLLGSIFHTGVTEEICKILPVIFYIYRSKENPNPKHAILIGIFSGLGFAAFENLMYSEIAAEHSVAMGFRAGKEGVFVGALAAQVNVMARAVSLVFLHAVYTGIFSYFIAVGVMSKSRVIALFVVGLLVSSVIHGFYNWFHSIQGTLSAAVCAFAFMLFYSYLTKLDQMLSKKSPEV
jgi:RsiW-degrading membrane proteinase PrsW (M82 family)